jgi:hypothetical protein
MRQKGPGGEKIKTVIVEQERKARRLAPWLASTQPSAAYNCSMRDLAYTRAQAFCASALPSSTAPWAP